MGAVRPQTPHHSPRQTFGVNFCKGARAPRVESGNGAGKSTWIALASPLREHNTNKHTETPSHHL